MWCSYSKSSGPCLHATLGSGHFLPLCSLKQRRSFWFSLAEQIKREPSAGDPSLHNFLINISNDLWPAGTYITLSSLLFSPRPLCKDITAVRTLRIVNIKPKESWSSSTLNCLRRVSDYFQKGGRSSGSNIHQCTRWSAVVNINLSLAASHCLFKKEITNRRHASKNCRKAHIAEQSVQRKCNRTWSVRPEWWGFLRPWLRLVMWVGGGVVFADKFNIFIKPGRRQVRVYLHRRAAAAATLCFISTAYLSDVPTVYHPASSRVTLRATKLRSSQTGFSNMTRLPQPQISAEHVRVEAERILARCT